MKSLKSLFAVALFVSASLSFAQEAPTKIFNFSYFGNQGGSYSMVSCDYATAQAMDFLELFGAENVHVSCSGGITPVGIFPLSLRAEYVAPIVGDKPVVDRVEYRSDAFNPSCFFNTQLVRQMVPEFSNVKIVRKNDACFNPTSRFSYEFEISLASF